MKKIIVTALIFSMAIGANAQEVTDKKRDDRGRHEGMKDHDGHRGMDFKSLNLTEEQRAKFKTQNENFHKQMEELKKNDGITVKEWRSKMENLRNEQKAQMQNLLTPDQKAKLQNLRAEDRTKFEARSKERSEMLKTKLGLTEEQSLKLERSRQQTGEAIKALRENKSLDEEKKREQMKELMKQQKENMKSILTEDQLKKLKESKGEDHERNGKRPGKKESI